MKYIVGEKVRLLRSVRGHFGCPSGYLGLSGDVLIVRRISPNGPWPLYVSHIAEVVPFGVVLDEIGPFSDAAMPIDPNSSESGDDILNGRYEVVERT